jgi:bacillolysin
LLFYKNRTCEIIQICNHAYSLQNSPFFLYNKIQKIKKKGEFEMRYNKIAGALLTFGLVFPLSTQAVEAEDVNKGKVSVEVAQSGLTIGKLTAPQTEEKETIVKKYLKGDIAGAKAQEEQITTEENANFVINSKEQKDGQTEFRLSQTYNGVKVYGQDVIVKVEDNGVITTVSGKVAKRLDTQRPLKARKLLTDQEIRLIVKRSASIPFDAVEKEFTSEKVIFKKEDGTYTFAKVVTFTYENAGKLVSGNAVIDMTNGKVLFKDQFSNKKEVAKKTTIFQLLGTKELGSGTNALGENVTFNISKGNDNKYYLADSSRGSGIYIYDANYADSNGGNSKVGYPGRLVSSNTTTFSDKEAVGVMKNMSHIYDYFKKEHQLKSYDNKDTKVVASVHGFDSTGVAEGSTPNSWVNAFWHSGWKQMVFGDGLNGTLTSSVDVTAHEFGHAVFSGNTKSDVLKYPSNATRAINEGLADFWGVQVERYVNNGNWDWVIGDTLDGLTIRDIPNKVADGGGKLYINLKDFYNKVNKQESHANSGVISHVLYQLVEGETFNGESVEALGHDKVSKIVMHTLQNYATAAEDFESLQAHMVQSATELYGDATAREVEKAFKAHGYPSINAKIKNKVVNVAG